MPADGPGSVSVKPDGWVVEFRLYVLCGMHEMRV